MSIYDIEIRREVLSDPSMLNKSINNITCTVEGKESTCDACTVEGKGSTCDAVAVSAHWQSAEAAAASSFKSQSNRATPKAILVRKVGHFASYALQSLPTREQATPPPMHGSQIFTERFGDFATISIFISPIGSFDLQW